MSENYTDQEKAAFRKGFLFGFNDEDGPRNEQDLLMDNPYPTGTPEHKAWLEGYYNNL